MVAMVGILANCLENDGTHVHSHAVFDAYVSCVSLHLGCIPLIIPCLGSLLSDGPVSATGILEKIDGLLLPGSLSNVHPSRYGASSCNGLDHFDEIRDASAFQLIRAARDQGVPLLGICRGAQEINCALGGSLQQALHTVPNYLDHRARGDLQQHLKYGPAHSIVLNPGSWLERDCARRNLAEAELWVNSLHGQAISRLGAGLVVDAWASDGVVEAISMPDSTGLIIAVQWHPEWHVEQSRINAIILDRFRDSVFRYREGRRLRL